MKKGRISIIVPVYKTEAYLKRCVESLRMQSVEGLEIVLVDDGSPDRCPALCDEYAAADPRITVLHKENGGLMSAWQAGVRKSTGEILCFVDSDDWIEKDMLSSMTPLLKGCGKEIVCCNFVIERSGRVTEHYHALAPGVYEGRSLEEIKTRLLGNENRTVSMSRCMKLFSRELIEDNMKYGDPRITMGEDVNITLPALLDCKRLVIMEGALYYHYFYNDTSMVHAYDPKLYEGIRLLYHTVQEIFRDKEEQAMRKKTWSGAPGEAENPDEAEDPGAQNETRGPSPKVRPGTSESPAQSVRQSVTQGVAQCAKEYVFLLFLVVKNELRGAENGVKRVKEICLQEENRRIIREYPVQVKEKGNRLLYFVLRHPYGPAPAVLRGLLRGYRRR